MGDFVSCLNCSPSWHDVTLTRPYLPEAPPPLENDKFSEIPGKEIIRSVLQKKYKLRLVLYTLVRSDEST